MYLSGRQQKSTPTRNKRKTLPCVTRSDTRKKHKTGRQRIDRKAILAKRCTPKPTPTKDTDATTRQSPTPKESETDDPSPSNREVSKKLPLSPKISEDLSPVDIEIANKASKVSKSAEIKKTLHDALDPRVQKGKRDKKKKKRRRTGAVKLTWAFYQGMDSPGSDYRNKPFRFGPEKMKKKCVDLGCVAFNSNGWIKTEVAPRDEWIKFSSSSGAGIYVLQSSENHQHGSDLVSENESDFEPNSPQKSDECPSSDETYTESVETESAEESSEPESSEDYPECDIEKVLKKVKKKDVWYYYVKWKGCPESENCWITDESVISW